MATESSQDRTPHKMVTVFEYAELVLYGAVAVLLVVIAIISLLDEVGSITSYLVTESPILGVQALLNTIIILELLMTVVGYLKTKSISLGLLLGAGLTAMIRKIITVGYQPLAVQDFTLALVAIAILVAAIFFVGDRAVRT